MCDIGDILLDRYEVLQKLGKGSQAIVYKVRDLKQGRIIALKQILGVEFYAQEDIDQIKLEFNLLTSLHHPNIIQGYDYFQLPDQIILTMEFIDGQSLDQLVLQKESLQISEFVRSLDINQFVQFIEYNRFRPDLLQTYQSFVRLKFREQFSQQNYQVISEDSEFSEESEAILNSVVQMESHQQIIKYSWYKTISDVFTQLCDALSYLDQMQIVHRDLKPQNVLVSFNADTNYFEVKIIDFGSAAAQKNKTVKNQMLGTQGYIAPEMFALNKLLQLKEEKPLSLEQQTLMQKMQSRIIPHKLDTWALGSILFCMISGFHPFVPTRNEAYETFQLENGLFLPPDLCIACPIYFYIILKELFKVDQFLRPTALQIKKQFIVEQSRFENRRKIQIIKPNLIKPINNSELKRMQLLNSNVCVPVQKIRILLIGESGLGKSTITKQFGRNNPYRVYEHKSELFLLAFTDSQGTEERRNSMLPEVCENLDLCVICTTSPSDVEQWREIIQQYCQAHFVVLLIQNTVILNEDYIIVDEHENQTKAKIREKYDCFDWNEKEAEHILEKIITCYRANTQPKIVLIPLDIIKGVLK
ncbi:Kinase [Hexamita inflata]|uniref:Kinase n=1 Tax=Hexamita inflata TaxID=28002 RepID=A0AA86NRG7_9EUKA|nr:Kinase [Hexamita inflata]